jgi:hypothetical protein
MHFRNDTQKDGYMELGNTLIDDLEAGHVAFQPPGAVAQRIIDLAWTAGFFDGEACIHISKTQIPGRKNLTYRLVVSVTQNHLGSLKRVTRTLGVPHNVYDVRRSVGMNRDAYTLNICDQHAVRAMRLLLPYLSRKAPEAQVAIDAYVKGKMNVHPGPKGHAPEVWAAREKAYKKLRNMK